MAGSRSPRRGTQRGRPGMTVWWSQFQEPLFGKPAQHRRHVGEDAFARPPNSFCDIIHDRGECRCAWRSNRRPRRLCNQPRNLHAGQRLRSDRRARRQAAVNAAACICARGSGDRALAIGRDGKASLRTRLARKPRASRSTEHDDGRALHGDSEGLGCGSELGRQVAVDLEADADLDKGRGRPRHGTLHEIL